MKLFNRKKLMTTEEVNVYYNAMTDDMVYENPKNGKRVSFPTGGIYQDDEAIAKLLDGLLSNEPEMELVPKVPPISLKKTLTPSEQVYEHIMQLESGQTIDSKDLGYYLAIKEPNPSGYSSTYHIIFVEYEFEYDNYFVYWTRSYGNTDKEHEWRHGPISELYSKEEIKNMYEKMRDLYNQRVPYSTNLSWYEDRIKELMEHVPRK